MYHSNGYVVDAGDVPSVRMCGTNGDIPVLQLEPERRGALSIQFNLDTPEQVEDTIGYLRALSREATRLERMVEVWAERDAERG